MGFGSYDESEQQKGKEPQESDEEEIKANEEKEANYDGQVSFEMEDTDAAIGRLQDIREDSEED